MYSQSHTSPSEPSGEGSFVFTTLRIGRGFGRGRSLTAKGTSISTTSGSPPDPTKASSSLEASSLPFDRFLPFDELPARFCPVAFPLRLAVPFAELVAAGAVFLRFFSGPESFSLSDPDLERDFSELAVDPAFWLLRKSVMTR